eukprot:358057_1
MSTLSQTITVGVFLLYEMARGQYNLSQWTQEVFPSTIGRVMLGAIGYDLDHKIFIVGGVSDLDNYNFDNVLVYDISHNTFMYQPHILPQSVRSYGRGYCQINRIIYILNDATYKDRSCLTNAGQHHLALIGGYSSILQGNSTYYGDSTYFGIFNLKDGSYTKGENTYYSRDLGTCESTATYLYAIAGGVWHGTQDSVEILEFDISNIAEMSAKRWSILGDRLFYPVTSLKSVSWNNFVYILGGAPTPMGVGMMFYVIDTNNNHLIRLNNISVDQVENDANWYGMAMNMVTATYTSLYSFGGLYIDKFLYASFVNPVNTLSWEFETEQPTFHPTIHPTVYPTVQPTIDPTEQTTIYPTRQPTVYPTWQPTMYPNNPTKYPTKYPIKYPTKFPIETP